MPNLRDFRQVYSAELLMRADEQTAPGALYDWVGLSHRRLDPRGLNIAHELLPDAEAQTMVDTLLAAPTFKTQFSQLDITREVKAEADIELPNVLSELKTSLDISKVLSFGFEDVISRPMAPGLRMQIRALVDKLREEDAPTYRKRIRPFLVVDNLFYASRVVIKLEAHTQLSAAARLAVENAPGGSISSSADSTIVIKYSQSDCPFAAELTPGKKL